MMLEHILVGIALIPAGMLALLLFIGAMMR